MKIIKPNEIKLERINSKRVYHSVEEAISKVSKINKSKLQYSQGELDGLVLDCQMHPLIEAAHVAFSDHLPLVLTPDAVWHCISNAVAFYVNQNSEDIRKRFVNHEDRKQIVVRRDNFVFGTKNPWNEVIDEFSEKIKESTKENIVDRLQADFTTTSKIARVASQIVVMDAMQKYFDQKLHTLCGIPEIRIAGEKQDWENIKQKANGLADLIPEFKKWLDQLSEILDQFINVFENKVDNAFWNEIYKKADDSGGPYISGWIICLHPYLSKGRKNAYVWENTWKEANRIFHGLKTSDFFVQFNKVPFKWNYMGSEFDMHFIGGLVGVNVNCKDSAVTPVFGYAVAESENNL